MSEVNDATDLLLTETEERTGAVEERLSSWASTAKTNAETLVQAADALTAHFRGRSETFSEHVDGSAIASSSKVEASFLTQAIQSLEAAALGVRAASSALGSAKDEGAGRVRRLTGRRELSGGQAAGKALCVQLYGYYVPPGQSREVNLFTYYSQATGGR